MSPATTGLYEFGPFRLDLERRLFRRDDQVLPLAPKAFDLLLLLVQSPGHAFSKPELMTALWPDTFVEEANLSFQISALRKTLGEDGARWIETVPKYGYRFSAVVRATAPGAAVSAEPSRARDEAPSVMPGRSTKKRWLASVIVTASLLAIVSFLIRARASHTDAVRTSPALAVPLTAYPGFELWPNLSPDGSQVAFSWNGPTLENYDIYVKLVGPGEPVRLTTNPAPDALPAWSPDGRLVAFFRLTSLPPAADLIVIPALGGAEKTIATFSPSAMPSKGDPFRDLSWTPDGRWLAFGGTLSPNGSQGIWLISVDGTKQRRLTDAPRGGRDRSPVVSPDGRRIAFLRERTLNRAAIFLLPVTSDWAPTGTPRQLTSDESAILGLAWAPDGRDLVFSSGGHLGLSRIARIPATSDSGTKPEPEFLSFGEQATGISISRTGRLVYSAQFRDTALYELALPRPLTSPIALSAFSSTFDEHTPDYSPDGKRLAFASTRSGAEEIWVANRDGSNPLQMTSMGGPLCANPQWSPDGRTILFNSRRAGSADLYLLQPDTGKLTRLTNDPADELEARWSRDGRWIYFGSNRTGRWEVWRMPAAGGAPTQLTRQGGLAAIESRDGSLYYSKDASSPSSIWRVPIDGGREARVVDGLSYSINFAVGDRSLYFIAVGDTLDKASVDFFDVATGKRSTLARLDKPYWVGITLAPGERSLVFPMVDSAGSNLMLVDSFR
jgi:Tol biopolymer transport system component/DNA-binding winged helix-turn-helix (wHTH) protein